MEANKELVNHLNELLEKHHDAVRGYEEAAQKVSTSSLKTFLERNANTRRSFAQDLKQEVVSLGGDPESSTSAKADLHRTWLNFKSALSSENDEAVLEECIRGEDAAIKDYDETIRSGDIPQGLNDKLQNQRDQIQQARNELKSLEIEADRRN